MAQRGYWYGFISAVLIFIIIVLSDYINICLCGLVSAIILLSLLHNFLMDVRKCLKQKHQLWKVEDMAKTLYPDNNQVYIRFTEIRQHVKGKLPKEYWVAGVHSTDTGVENTMLIQTDGPIPTKNEALAELCKVLAKTLIKKAVALPTATNSSG